MTKQHCHTSPYLVKFLSHVTVLFGHATGGGVIKSAILADLSYGVIMLFYHVTGGGVTKGVRIGNKVRDRLTLK